MNILKFLKTGPIKNHDEKYNTGITGRRWSFFIDIIHIGFQQEYHRNDKWHCGIGYYIAGIHTDPKNWTRFGYESIYYDGNHHVFSVGPFFVSWLS